MISLKDSLKSKESYLKGLQQRHKYVSREFQDFGYKIAAQLGETERASLYIKVAKEYPRAVVMQAYSFAVDYPKAKNRGRLFMWKLAQLSPKKKSKPAVKSKKKASDGAKKKE